MPITKDIDRKKNLTFFKITGRVPFDDFRESIIEFYESGATDLIIFDLREAEGTGKQFSHDRITKLVDFIVSTRRGREKGKTAMVANKDIFFGISSMVEAYLRSSEIQVRTFRTMEKAVEWIEEGKEVS